MTFESSTVLSRLKSSGVLNLMMTQNNEINKLMISTATNGLDISELNAIVNGGMIAM